jgi:hypothetical protein
MDSKHLNPAGGRVAQCTDETACTVVSCAASGRRLRSMLVMGRM